MFQPVPARRTFLKLMLPARNFRTVCPIPSGNHVISATASWTEKTSKSGLFSVCRLKGDNSSLKHALARHLRQTKSNQPSRTTPKPSQTPPGCAVVGADLRWMLPLSRLSWLLPISETPELGDDPDLIFVPRWAPSWSVQRGDKEG